MPDNQEQRYDVIIYHRETKEVDSVVGVDLRMSTGFYTARKRLEMAKSRINDQYEAAIVQAGKCRVGQLFEEINGESDE